MTMQIDTKVATRLKDIGGVILFVAAVFIGALLINTFVFRSFNVDGPSMEDTLHTGDRLIVNRLPVTWAKIRGVDYIPERGQVIVFKNPKWQPGEVNEYIVKRVIAFPGERVTVKNGKMMVYPSDHPEGIDVDEEHPGALQPTDGNVDMVVSEGQIFVAGDHRQDPYSLDSRKGLGTIPFDDIIGPVNIRIFPFNQIRFF
jgi:signal peptidase I